VNKVLPVRSQLSVWRLGQIVDLDRIYAWLLHAPRPRANARV
jgi:hypothetical protein